MEQEILKWLGFVWQLCCIIASDLTSIVVATFIVTVESLNKMTLEAKHFVLCCESSQRLKSVHCLSKKGFRSVLVRRVAGYNRE